MFKKVKVKSYYNLITHDLYKFSTCPFFNQKKTFLVTETDILTLVVEDKVTKNNLACLKRVAIMKIY